MCGSILTGRSTLKPAHNFKIDIGVEGQNPDPSNDEGIRHPREFQSCFKRTLVPRGRIGDLPWACGILHMMCRTYGAGASLFPRTQRLHAGLTCGAPTALPFAIRLWVSSGGIHEKLRDGHPACTRRALVVRFLEILGPIIE